MEVRCGSCNKLFRIADEKISGSGIKFACSKCRGTVKITREEFERYLQLKTAEPVLPPGAGKQPLKMEVRCSSCSKPFRISEDKIAGSGIKFACSKCGASVTISKEDLEKYKRSLEKAAPASTGAGSAPPPAEAEMFKPAPAARPAAASAPQPAPPTPPVASTKPSTPATPAVKPAPKPQPPVSEQKTSSPQSEQAKPPVKPRPEPAGIVRPSAPAPASRPPASSSTVRQFLVLAAAILIIVAVGYMATSHFKEPAPVAKEPDGTLMSIEGLQVVNTTAVHDARGDYVISGDIVNTTDVERPAWLLVAEVFDGKGVLLGRARMLNGIELYTNRDYELLAKRGTNIQELKARNLQEQRSKILPRGTVHFEITILEAPAGGVKFDANLQPFDPVQLFKEVIAEQKQP